MWKKVRLLNFQRHEKTVVTLGPGVTTILGRTAAGKSSVLRAIRWVAFNRPAGASIIRRGREAASVTVVTSAGRVTRRRGKGVNEYLLDGDKSVAFGSAVPVQVAAALNLYPVNFQTQFAPPFWLADSPGDLSKKLNALTGLDKADRTAAALAARRRHLIAEIGVLAEHRDRAKRFLFACRPFAAVLEARRFARETGERCTTTAARRDLLADLVAAVESADRAKETARIASGAFGEYLTARKEKSADAQTSAVLADLIGEVVESAPSADAPSALEEAAAAFEEARESGDRSADSVVNLESCVQTVEEEVVTCRRLRKEIGAAAAAAMVCPTCGEPPPSQSSAPTGT